MTTMDWQLRVINENAELCAKIDRLTAFMDSEAAKGVHVDDFALLVAQRHAMQHYSDILLRRITNFGGKTGEA